MEALLELVRKSNLSDEAKDTVKMYLEFVDEAYRDTDKIEKSLDYYTMLEHRGWKLSYPCIIHSYNKFHLRKDDKHYTIISGSGFNSGSSYICLEALGDGDVERFDTLDQVIDWIENGEVLPDIDFEEDDDSKTD